MPPVNDEGLPEFSVSQFVALHNQVLEYAMPSVTIIGELSNYRVSRGKWVYFDLKDEGASVKFFGTVYNLSSPLEEGMLLRVTGSPRVHPQFGFSVTVLHIQPAGEGTIRRAADLLQQKLQAEGLFDPARKRPLPYPPERIGLITSRESAAYADFTKIIDARWGGLEITLANVQVQGEAAPLQITDAITAFNQLPEPPEVLVITRGGGSAEDLWAFSSEQVTRAVAASRIPTIVAIGHEIDLSLAELAADQRASTPSNAAELLVPDKQSVLRDIQAARGALRQLTAAAIEHSRLRLMQADTQLTGQIKQILADTQNRLRQRSQILKLLSPQTILNRGYAIVRAGDQIIRTTQQAPAGTELLLEFQDGSIEAISSGRVQSNKEKK